MSKELYLLVDGTHADPDDCDVGADNELRHKDNGVPVALREDGNPQTVAQGAVENMNVEAAAAGEAADAEAAQIFADDKAAREADKEAPVAEKSSDDDLLLTTDDLKPKAPKKVEAKPVKAKAAKAKNYKNRELKAR